LSTLPERLRQRIDDELAIREDRIDGVVPVSGGCINHGARLDTQRGGHYFLKWHHDAPAGMYQAEAEGLDALRSAAEQIDAGRVRIPAVIAIGDDGVRPGWLLMEFIAPAAGGSRPGATLGSCLAEIHHSLGPGDFGWKRDNWIGSLPQDNAPSSSWGAFWRDRRIVPQLDRARGSGYLRETDFDRLVDRIVPALGDVSRRELLHGDLWSGNSYRAATGEPVLIDPAVYAGDGEVDLAMTELFGGFDADFHEAYRERRPVSDAYGAYRRDLYQLYYLLVHVNLFGGSYVASALGAARRVLAALG
jgi:protein-ribulosamine 3-kinase